jgi:hypothetical protein
MALVQLSLAPVYGRLWFCALLISFYARNYFKAVI